MGEVVNFYKKNKNSVDRLYTINGVCVNVPNTGEEYLLLCKRFLDQNIYREILCSVLDQDFYKKAKPAIRKIVDNYLFLMKRR